MKLLRRGWNYLPEAVGDIYFVALALLAVGSVAAVPFLILLGR